MIYFAQDTKTKQIKIGVTRQLTKRMMYLRSKEKREIQVLGVLEGDFITEQEIHRQFHGSMDKGEWFKPTPELLKFIRDDCKRIGELPNADNSSTQRQAILEKHLRKTVAPFEIPIEGHKLIQRYARLRKLSYADALRSLLAQSSVLQELAGKQDLMSDFSIKFVEEAQS